MKTIEIYDPAMCCSTGVCGPSVDPELMRVATLINAYSKKGIEIKRYGLSTEPQAFVLNKIVTNLIQSEGAEVLPVVILEGEITKKGEYPSNEEFAAWTGVALDQEDKSSGGGCCKSQDQNSSAGSCC